MSPSTKRSGRRGTFVFKRDIGNPSLTSSSENFFPYFWENLLNMNYVKKVPSHFLPCQESKGLYTGCPSGFYTDCPGQCPDVAEGGEGAR